MNIIISLVLVAVTLYASFSLTPVAGYLPRNLIYYSPCETVRTYRIGDIDSQFGVTDEYVMSLLSRAAAVWNEASGRELFSASPDGEITVSMKYDIRQELGLEAKSLEETLLERRNRLTAEEAKYEDRIRAFENRLEAYKSEVAAVNARGGATPEEYARLTTEKEELEREARAVNDAIGSFNETTREYNAGVSDYRTTVESFNAEIGKRPEEGIYDPADNSITLYLYTDEKELLHTMIHEFGHAAGVEHLDNPEAVMYLYANGSTELTPADREALTEVCRDRKYTELAGTRLRRGLAVMYVALMGVGERLRSSQ